MVAVDYRGQANTHTHRFCEQHGLYDVQSYAEASHVCMAGYRGGMICVKGEQNIRGFEEAYARDLAEKKKVYIVEAKTPVFNLFFDFDIFHELSWDGDFERDVVAQGLFLAEQIRILFSKDVSVLASMAPPKRKNKDGVDYTKYGVHFNIPELPVTKEVARNVRRLLLVRFKEKWPLRYADTHVKSWEKIIDDTVFEESGLRMTGARKTSPHKECEIVKKGIKRCDTCCPATCPNRCRAQSWGTKCDECKRIYGKCTTCVDARRALNACRECGGKKVDEGRPYAPFAVFSPRRQGDEYIRDDDTLRKLEEDKLQQVRWTTVRNTGLEYYVPFSQDVHTYEPGAGGGGGGTRGRRRGGGAGAGGAPVQANPDFTLVTDGSEGNSNGVCSCENTASCVVCFAAIHGGVRQFVEEDMRTKLGIAAVFGVRRISYATPRGGRPRTYSVMTNCKWCSAKGDYHASNNTYFTLGVTGGRHRCMADACKKSPSENVKIPPALKKVLWPGRSKQKHKASRDKTRLGVKKFCADLEAFCERLLDRR